ncbi:hypothetical protein HGRIS_003987 [Hohenbuehelia grisea]|uniref:Beta-xylanase n=1 Tax=Hohenbuehelia grisea TaxID=104357 RepID=A0ABR3JH54_9AGAR
MKLIFAFFAACLPFVAAQAGLNRVAKAAGKLYFGTATNPEQFVDAPYLTVLSNVHEFGQLTPANSMKWDATEPSRGVFTFDQGDKIAALAKKNGQLLRGHNCVWHNQLPAWVTDGNFDAPTLSSIVETHCSTIVKHYKGQICMPYILFRLHSWDVINECLNDDGTFREDVFFNTLNTSYIATALRAARRADPKAKLYINDFNIEGTGPKSTALVNLVKSLKKQHVPIDGIGIQAHLIVGEVPSTLLGNFRRFTALGVEIAVTELDIRMTLPDTPELRAQQKQDYRTVIETCNAVRDCVGVTVWDFTDKYSWVPSAFDGEGDACPWDANIVRKPAYNGIVEGFRRRLRHLL